MTAYFLNHLQKKNEPLKINKAHKKLGYHKDREGLLNRYFREREAWEGHLEKTRQAIIDFSAGKATNSCVVMGSGWWLDVPVEFLCKNFNKVYFIDISHPAQIEKKALQFTNLELITADVTGVADTVWEYVSRTRKKGKFEELIEIINGANPFLDKPFANADYFVSVNLMSQLTVFLRRFLEKKSHFTNAEINKFEKLIHQKHIDLLPAGKSCLITDYKELCKAGNTKSENLIFAELPKASETRKWLWDFDLSGYYKNCKETVFEVIALNLDFVDY